MIKEIKVKVITRAARNEIIEEKDDFLKVRLTTPPIKGRANQALLKLLAVKYQVAPSQIELARGLTSRNKLVKIHY